MPPTSALRASVAPNESRELITPLAEIESGEPIDRALSHLISEIA
jgi:hypothetical protein